ncbi:SpoIIE family protein phosphatase [Streptomyces sp. NPDC005573]|uniref:SpoIIE family protein phosphatase n=1 Tax=Streptomyces sp. NPDC005573 TaxID=3156890 RepID=UPI0033AF2393
MQCGTAAEDRVPAGRGGPRRGRRPAGTLRTGAARIGGAQRHLRLPVGATLLLYTDGLVERRPGNDIDSGTRCAATLLDEGAGTPLHDLLTKIADRVAGAAPDDDVALLALRVTRGSPPVPGSSG